VATVANTSTTNEVILLPGTSIALLLPASNLRGQSVYQANTFGSYTSCAPASQECSLAVDPGGSLSYGCLEHPGFTGDLSGVTPLGNGQITSSSWKAFNQSGTLPVGGFDEKDQGAWSQPLELGVVVQFSSSLGNVSDPAVVYSAGTGQALLLWCQMNYLNVTYLYNPFADGYPVTILEYTLADADSTFTMSGPAYFGYGNAQIDFNTQTVVFKSDLTAFVQAYSEQLSRVTLGLAAGALEPSLSLVDYNTDTSQLGSQIPLPPLIVFLFVLLLFAISVLFVGFTGSTRGPVLTSSRSQEVAAVKLAQLRLTSSAPLVYETFCADDGLSGSSTVADLFRQTGGQEPAELNIGIRNRFSEGHFGVSTAPVRPLDSVSETMVL